LKGRVKKTFAELDAACHISTTEIAFALITEKSIALLSSPSKISDPSLSVKKYLYKTISSKFCGNSILRCK
jgi:hypothetical protein